MIAVAALGCDDRGGDAERDAPAGPEHRFVAVELAALADADAAEALRDSLAQAGWVAYVRESAGRAGSAGSADGGERRWVVRAAPSRNLAYAEVVAFAFRRVRGDSVRVVHDSSAVVGPQGVMEFGRVNYGAHGMAARVRWALSPDRRTILVVEDPASVENEPLPNGFYFATEQGMHAIQLDSVWDVTPSPDWRRVGFGRAHVLAGGAGEPSASAWAALADTIGVTTAALRRAAFRTSGMAIQWGAAQPGVAVLDSTAGDRLRSRVLYEALGGWRVRWPEAEGPLLVGRAPEHPRDDSPAAGWLALDLTTGRTTPAAIVGAAEGDTASAGEPAWQEGPVLDVSVPVDLAARTSVPIDGARLESAGGWIRLGDRVVGPGIVLAATRTGRFIVALVPNPGAEPHEPPHMLVVYKVIAPALMT